MKWTIYSLGFLCLLFSCTQKKGPIVSPSFVDSLLTHYDNRSATDRVKQDLDFWKDRIQPDAVDFVNSSRYAALLVNRFHLSGDIADLLRSDSVLRKLSADLNGKEASPLLALSRNAILQHRFTQADSLFRVADSIGIKNYDEAAVGFDVDFELGRISFAESELKRIAVENDYGYQFRRSKLMHYKGDLDSSLAAMQKAAVRSGNNEMLRNAALSNLADLYIHAGKPARAYEIYCTCIINNSSDLHSLAGIGRIALLVDGQDSLAERIFQFISTRTQSPDPFFQLIGVAEKRGDSVLMKKYASAFAEKASGPAYGNMYNKYLVYLYTGILSDRGKAELLTRNELVDRNTPQTNAWYAYALYRNGKAGEALAVYEKSVSGKPLEGLELYYMGKLMKALDKGYNADRYFDLAGKNRYDLPAGAALDLEKELDLYQPGP